MFLDFLKGAYSASTSVSSTKPVAGINEGVYLHVFKAVTSSNGNPGFELGFAIGRDMPADAKGLVKGWIYFSGDASKQAISRTTLVQIFRDGYQIPEAQFEAIRANAQSFDDFANSLMDIVDAKNQDPNFPGFRMKFARELNNSDKGDVYYAKLSIRFPIIEAAGTEPSLLKYEEDKETKVSDKYVAGAANVAKEMNNIDAVGNDQGAVFGNAPKKEKEEELPF